MTFESKIRTYLNSSCVKRKRCFNERVNDM